MNDTAMQDIKSKYEEANSMVNFNIVIPSNKKEIIRAFKGLINTFNKEISKADVNVYKFEKKGRSTYKEAKDRLFSKYAGAFNIKDNAENEYNQYRLKKYGK